MHPPAGGLCPLPTLTTKSPSTGAQIEQILRCWIIRLEVSLPSFKLGPFPLLELPPNTIMGGDVWNRMGGFKSCFLSPTPFGS